MAFGHQALVGVDHGHRAHAAGLGQGAHRKQALAGRQFAPLDALQEAVDDLAHQGHVGGGVEFQGLHGLTNAVHAAARRAPKSGSLL